LLPSGAASLLSAQDQIGREQPATHRMCGEQRYSRNDGATIRLNPLAGKGMTKNG